MIRFCGEEGARQIEEIVYTNDSEKNVIFVSFVTYVRNYWNLLT